MPKRLSHLGKLDYNHWHHPAQLAPGACLSCRRRPYHLFIAAIAFWVLLPVAQHTEGESCPCRKRGTGGGVLLGVSRTTDRTMPMQEDIPFLRAIFQQPDDEAVRLIYADWLEERGDPRAEYLRLEVELYPLAKDARSRRATLQKQIGALQPRLDAGWLARMGWVRGLPRGTRLDLVVLAEGKGLIEVRGGEPETVLLVEGKPVALNWDDCRGSLGQYLVHTGHTCGSEYVRHLGAIVAGEIDEGRPLAEQIEPLLALFVPGTYCITYTPSAVVRDIATLEYASQSSANRGPVGYYPAEQRILVCTQTRESLDVERVAFYRKQIRAQQRPIVLTTSAEGAWCEFVIDGHHKLEAYNQEGVQPAILGIVRWKAPTISLEEGLRFLPRGHRGVKEYRRMKGYQAE
jgi:uncharacterized protein (TIGR02996 family)